MGLSAAYQLKESLPSAQVTIIANEFVFQTTSCGSGGLWEPYQIGNTSPENINRWSKESLRHFLQLYHSIHANTCGVQQMTAYQLFREDEEWEAPSWKDVAISYALLDPAQLGAMGLSTEFTGGYAFGTVVVDQKMYLTWMMKQLETYVKFEQRHVSSLKDVICEYDCVLNCTGLGSGLLMDDPAVFPIRGQVLRVEAPWIKSAYFFNVSGDSPSYLIPNIGSVVVGGTAQRGNASTTVSRKDTQRIIEGVSKLFPALKHAKVLQEWVGLRPAREIVRLERDEGVKDKLLIHNYGHGGSGVTLAMGCAKEMVEMILIPNLKVASKL